MGMPQIIAASFEPERVPGLIERFGVTSTGMTSGMLSRLAAVCERPLAGGTLRRLLYGGAPLAREDMQRAVDILGPVLVQVYGRLEGGWPLTVLDQDDHAAILAGDDSLASSCGRPVEDAVELRLRALADRADGAGELCTRSDMVVTEYADPDGWCALGDLARRDAAGHVHLCGRLDDMINTGYHVYPAQIEQALRSLAHVSAARVVGEPDERRGEAIAAYIVAGEDAPELDPETLRRELRGLLAPYKIPHRISVVERLPA
jgi:acyl-CoA synthetase (AMP-forming)/AMP-acid ligase II